MAYNIPSKPDRYSDREAVQRFRGTVRRNSATSPPSYPYANFFSREITIKLPYIHTYFKSPPLLKFP